ncbi:UDP-galactopyranose mutase [Parasutterella muris]|uniref:UDP-galactopyranose mutase n=1 Tax=Parasutterella muris TaxID=2565572 RepID=UPI00203F0F5A|nr:UDP-galactopyranose mutase [Parasutterella muris]
MAFDIEESDFIIVGAGLVGAVIARELAVNQQKKILIWERRNHIAGNMYDYIDDFGIRVHKYGPHVFHTNDENLFDYITQFGEFDKFSIDYLAEIDGIQTPTPFNFKTIDDFFPRREAEELKQHIKEYFPFQETVPILKILKHSDPIIRKYGEFLFEKDYAPYTAKQWGISPKDIDPSVLARVPVRFSYKIGYFDDKFQALPSNGYTAVFNNILNHKNINIELNTDALSRLFFSEDNTELLVKGLNKKVQVIYTGALDELFDWSLGALPYRSLKFEWRHEKVASFQNAPIVAYPQEPLFTRITEYNKLPVQQDRGASYAIEYPQIYDRNKEVEPYYPILTNESQTLYKKYLEKASKVKNLTLAGRLADFKYYNMDQALKRALETVQVVINKRD